MPGAFTPRHEPELSGARDSGQSGREPSLGGARGLDWGLWDALLNDSAPAPLRAALIPSQQRSTYVSALLEALLPGATYTRPMKDGTAWRCRFTNEQRLSAIRLLGAMRERRAAGPLARQLDDSSNHTRIAIIMALGWIGGPVAVSALASLLTHPHEATRIEAVRWLGWIGDSLAREPLARALGDSSKSVREAAARALARLNDPRAFGPLVEAFWRSRGMDQDQILNELRRYDQERTMRILVQARGGPDAARYEAATRALRRLGTPEAVAALEHYDHRATGNFDDF